MKDWINRRHFLKSTLVGSLLYNPIIRFREAAAAGAAKRLIVLFYPLGVIRENWLPSGTETNFVLSKILRPLEAYKSRLIVCDGINMLHRNGNHKEFGVLLTGTMCDGTDQASRLTNISLDQVIANHFSGQTRFKSLELAAWDDKPNELQKPDHRILSARGPGQHILAEGDAQKAFDRIFAGVSSSAGVPPVGADSQRKRSILDAIVVDLQSLQKELSGNERAKLDQHLSAIREIEKRLQSPVQSGLCTLPGRPGRIDMHHNDSLPSRLKAQTDIMLAAMMCDLTRVGTLIGEGGEARSQPVWLGLGLDWHDNYTHSSGGREEHTKISEWYHQQWKYVLDRLAAVLDGNGSMLDNSLVLILSEQGCRYPSGGPVDHSTKSLPFVIVGSAGGHFRPGRFLNFGGVDHQRFLISIMNAMGVAGNTMGNFSAQPLPL